MPRRFASDHVIATLLNIFSSSPPNTAIPAEYLKERTGESIRVVRDGIQRLILDHELPIISDRDGSYLLSTRPAILLAEAQRLQSQSREIGARGTVLWSAALRFGARPGHLSPEQNPPPDAAVGTDMKIPARGDLAAEPVISPES